MEEEPTVSICVRREAPVCVTLRSLFLKPALTRCRGSSGQSLDPQLIEATPFDFQGL